MTYPGTLLRTSNLLAKKELGQNFLADPKAAERIVNLARISKDDIVLEIGAGFGALTVHAAKQAAKIYAVEKDTRLIEILENELALASINNVELIHKDIFKVDIKNIAYDHKDSGKLVVIGNLPYNISSQVLFRLVENRDFISRAVLMFQKELAERISSPPGNRDYGRLSAVMQYCSTVKNLTNVGANLFFPKPAVESRVIEVNFFTPDLYETSGSCYLPHEQEVFLFKVIKAAFSKRRKTLRNSLAGSELELSKGQIEKGLAVAEIDPERRAETLCVKEFIKLSLALCS
ncbi:MAG: ribosomal RNA small subunit methyltransferase A [Desulfamplus sp.]|nr:ribosomal RNA small subunit methyltransferase A [Desulfamplus sp.]MBF0411296.1 ribosomal RNA small subunit methyltransferase A [Desulfamplus sp.]